MSLNYGTLKTQILGDAHRPDLGDTKAADFVRQAEGVIARQLRCAEMMTRASFEEADRVAGGIYSLPADYLQEGIIWSAYDVPLEKVGLRELRTIKAATNTCIFSPLSSSEIEFRGVPGQDAEMEQIYFARPTAFSGDSDVNSILTLHETIYINAGLSALYAYTQDLEMAKAMGGVAQAAIDTLNEQAGRLLAGARADGHYNLSSFGSY